MEVGKHTYGIKNITIRPDPSAKLIIGAFCSIADNVTIFLGRNHRIDWITTYPFGHSAIDIFDKFDGKGHPKSNGDVVIGNDVWIGSNVTIMSGIKIGDGAVVSANSHVVENVKPYSVVGGNPSQFYFFRFNVNIINKLLEIKWWNFEDDIINDLSPILCSNNFDEFFRLCENINIKYDE